MIYVAVDYGRHSGTRRLLSYCCMYVLLSGCGRQHVHALLLLLVRRCCRWIANSRLLQHRSHSVEQEVEWMYALDIHSNSFFPLFVWLYVVQVRQTTLLVFFFLDVVTFCDLRDFSMARSSAPPPPFKTLKRHSLAAQPRNRAATTAQ